MSILTGYLITWFLPGVIMVPIWDRMMDRRRGVTLMDVAWVLVMGAILGLMNIVLIIFGLLLCLYDSEKVQNFMHRRIL